MKLGNKINTTYASIWIAIRDKLKSELNIKIYISVSNQVYNRTIEPIEETVDYEITIK